MNAILPAAAFFVASTLSVGAVTLNFDTDNSGSTVAGDINGTEFTDFGVTISVAGDTNQLALFNSNCGPDFPGTPCTGGDPDLASGVSTFGTQPQGRVLIGQENNADEPDDQLGTYTFTFDFSPRVALTSVSMLDLDEGEFDPGATNLSFRRTFADGTIVEDFSSNLAFSIIGSGDNSLATFSFAESGVTSLEVAFNGISGSISAVEYTPIPVPAALPLLGAGLAALCFVRRRRKG